MLYRLATSGSRKGVKPKREDGVIRPLLPLWRAETRAFCDERELRYRIDSSNPNTIRGLIRDGILPLLEQIHPAARQNILRALEERRTMPPALAELSTRRSARSASTSATASRPCASTTACGSSGARSSCRARCAGARG